MAGGMDLDFANLAPRFAALRDYLDGLKGARRLARRSDLDPAAIAAHLPFINLIDVVLHEDAVRFRFRLVGTAQSAVAQLDYQGRFVDDVVAPDWRRRVIDDLSRAVATCRPHYGRYGMPFPGRGFIESERVFYPLSEDGRMVDAILALHRYPELEAAEAGRFTAESWHLAAFARAASDL